VVDGRPAVDVTFEVVGELFEKVLLIDKQDRCVMVEVPLQETVLAIKRAAIRMGDKEFARTGVYRGSGKGSNTGAGVVGKYEDLAFHARVVSLKGQGFFLELSVILDFAHGAAGQGPKDAPGQGSQPNLAFDVDVPGPKGNHVFDLI
jgi:hypothetical protein